MSQPPRLTVCYILAYRQPNYIRTQTLLQALQHLPQVKLVTAINRRRGVLRYWDTLRQLWQLRQCEQPDVYILGFRGHELFWPVRWLTRSKPLIFDSLLSPTAALIDEQKQGKLGVQIGRWLMPFERAILQRADLVLTDTQLHVRFLCQRFQLPPAKVQALPVGADESLPSLPARVDNTRFEVLFYGSFLPLHGMDIMLQAAAQLRDQPIHFTFIGGTGQNLRQFAQLRQHYDLGETVTHIQWVEFDELIQHYIPQADLGLGGPFGNTPQAQRVVTGKTSQFLALGKATVIGQIDEAVGFIDKQNCLLVPQGNVTALAEAILWASQHRTTLPSLGQAGLQLYQSRLSIEQIAHGLQLILEPY